MDNLRIHYIICNIIFQLKPCSNNDFLNFFLDDDNSKDKFKRYYLENIIIIK